LKNDVLHPLVERPVGELVGGGLGRVAHGVVGFFLQPVGDGRRFGRPTAQQRGREQPFGPAAAQEVDGPGGIGRRRVVEVGAHRGDLVVGAGGGVERIIKSCKRVHCPKMESTQDDRSTLL